MSDYKSVADALRAAAGSGDGGDDSASTPTYVDTANQLRAASQRSLDDIIKNPKTDAATRTPMERIQRDIAIAGGHAAPPMVGAIAGGTVGAIAGGGFADPVTVPAGAIMGAVAVPAADLVARGYNSVAPKMGLPQSGIPSDAIRKLIGTPEPENKEERVSAAVGDAAGQALTQVPTAGMLAKTATSPYTRGVMDTISTSPKTQMVAAPLTAGVSQDVAEDTGSNAAGNVAGVLTALGTGTLSGAGIRPQVAALSRENLISAKNNLYDAMNRSGVLVDKSAVDSWANKAIADATGKFYDPAKLHTSTASAVDAVRSVMGDDASITNLDDLRQALRERANSAYRSGNGKDGYRVDGMIDSLDDFMGNLNTQQLAAGNTQDAEATMQNVTSARDAFRKSAKMGDIQQILDTSDNLQNKAYIQQQFQRIVKNPRQMRQYSDDEQDLIKQIAQDGSAKTIAKFVPYLSFAGNLKGGFGAIASAALKPGAGMIEGAGKVKAANNLLDTISRGAPNQSIYQRMYLKNPVDVTGPTMARLSVSDIPNATPPDLDQQRADRARAAALGQ